MKAILGRGNFPKKNISLQIGGSKSESNRLLILKAQFPNISIVNLSESDDTEVLQKGLKIQKGTVDVHHAGTAMRFLTAYFAAREGAQIILTGSHRMQERPIGVLVDALRHLGADIEYMGMDGFPPLKIKGKLLYQNEVRIKSDISSQFVSALMLIAPMLPNGLHILLEGKAISKPYVEMTFSLLKQLGIQVNFLKNEIAISSANEVASSIFTVESDWSSASYFYSLAALSENGEITLKNFKENSLQGDSALKKIYECFGVKTEFNQKEKSITLSKQKTKLAGFLVLDLTDTPDLAQTIAVTCFGLGIVCKLTGLATLKIKETDRLLALKTELEKLGARVTVDSNSLHLQKSTQITAGQTIDTYHDHRMAMAFAPLGIKTDLTIADAEVVSKSYPHFWQDLKNVGLHCVLEKTSL